MTFAEQMEIQRKRQERRMEDLVKRQRLSFAEEYARMEAAFVNDPQKDDEDNSDLG